MLRLGVRGWGLGVQNHTLSEAMSASWQADTPPDLQPPSAAWPGRAGPKKTYIPYVLSLSLSLCM